ncbi:MAG: hypothetical protein ABI920_06315 [Casimicrobiaceae bacterium]
MLRLAALGQYGVIEDRVGEVVEVRVAVESGHQRMRIGLEPGQHTLGGSLADYLHVARSLQSARG